MKLNRKILCSAHKNIRQNKNVHPNGHLRLRFVFPMQTTRWYSRVQVLRHFVSCTCICAHNLWKEKWRGKSIENTSGLYWGNKAIGILLIKYGGIVGSLGKGGTWNRQEKLRGTEHAATRRDTRVHWEMHDSSSGLYEEFCTGSQQFLSSNTAGIWTTFTGTEMKTACWITL